MFDPSSVPVTKRRRLEFDTSDVSTQIDDFVLVIKMEGTDFEDILDDLNSSTAQKFSLEQDGSQCYVEIEYWDTGTATIHVKVDYPTSDFFLFLSWDETQDDNTDYVGWKHDTAAESVWDSSHDQVYLYNDTGSRVDDSVGDIYDGPVLFASGPVDGIMGKCWSTSVGYVGSCSNFYAIPDDFTLELVLKMSGSRDGPVLYRPSETVGEEIRAEYDESAHKITFTIAGETLDTGANILDNTWHSISITMNSSYQITLRVDGVQRDTATASNGVANHGLYVGSDDVLSDYTDTKIETVRSYVGVKSNEWRDLFYNSYQDNLLLNVVPWGGEGEYDLPMTEVEGDGTVTIMGNAELTLSVVEIYGEDTAVLLGGGLFELPEVGIEGTGLVANIGNVEFTISAPTYRAIDAGPPSYYNLPKVAVAGTGFVTVLGDGEFNLKKADYVGAGFGSISGNGDFTIPTVSFLGDTAQAAYANYNLPAVEISGEGTSVPLITGEGAYSLEYIKLYISGYNDGGELLEYKRPETNKGTAQGSTDTPLEYGR